MVCHHSLHLEVYPIFRHTHIAPTEAGISPLKPMTLSKNLRTTLHIGTLELFLSPPECNIYLAYPCLFYFGQLRQTCCPTAQLVFARLPTFFHIFPLWARLLRRFTAGIAQRTACNKFTSVMRKRILPMCWTTRSWGRHSAATEVWVGKRFAMQRQVRSRWI